MAIYTVLITAIYITIIAVEYYVLMKSKDLKAAIPVTVLCCLGYIMALAAVYDYQPLNIIGYIYDLYIPLYNALYK